MNFLIQQTLKNENKNCKQPTLNIKSNIFNKNPKDISCKYSMLLKVNNFCKKIFEKLKIVHSLEDY